MRRCRSILILFSSLLFVCISGRSAYCAEPETLPPEETAWDIRPYLESEEALPLDDEDFFEPPVTDDQGRFQVWDLNDNVAAWIPLPEGFYAAEEYTTRNALVLWPADTDSLNADVSYYVYDASDGYLDLNMDDPLEEEYRILSADEELVCSAPTPAESFQAGDREMLGASLHVSYEPDDGAPVYTTEYLIWTHLDERIIVVCHVAASSANQEPLFSMEDAGVMFLSPVSPE